MKLKILFVLPTIVLYTTFSNAQKNKIDKKSGERKGKWKIGYVIDFKSMEPIEVEESKAMFYEVVSYSDGEKNGKFTWVDATSNQEVSKGEYSNGQMKGNFAIMLPYSSERTEFNYLIPNHILKSEYNKVSFGFIRIPNATGVTKEVQHIAYFSGKPMNYKFIYMNANGGIDKIKTMYTTKVYYVNGNLQRYLVWDDKYDPEKFKKTEISFNERGDTTSAKYYTVYGGRNLVATEINYTYQNTKYCKEVIKKGHYGEIENSLTYCYDSNTGNLISTQFNVYSELNNTSYKSFTVEVQDKKMNGVGIEFYSNGDTLSIASYKNDLLNGPATYFYNDGQVCMTMHFSNGKLNGEAKAFIHPGLKNNAILYQSNHEKNLELVSEVIEQQKISQFGEIKEYRLFQIVHYNEGLLSGPYSIFYNDGSPWAKAFFEKGEMVFYEKYDKEGNIIKVTEKYPDLASKKRAEYEAQCNQKTKCDWCGSSQKYCDMIHYSGSWDCGNRSYGFQLANIISGKAWHFCSNKCKSEYNKEICKKND